MITTGYATPLQTGRGLLFRARARAFVILDNNTNKRIVYVSVDLGMGFQMVKDGVMTLLQKQFGTLYTYDNVIISGTHTHATPGGIGGTTLVDITTLGFIKPNYDAAVNGIYEAIVIAHNRVTPASIKYNYGQIAEVSNINRSPSAYLLNPDKDAYAANTDTEMTVLRIESLNGTELGMISFFPVHGTSLNNTNMFVAGDNKGYAALLFEKYKNPGSLPGFGPFVAAFGQANEGDVSPNTKGPSCPDG